MMRLTTIFVIGLAVTLGGCAQRYRPIHNVDRPMPPGVARLSQDRIRDIIIAAGKPLDWSMTSVGPSHLEATEKADKYSATVDIYYTPVRLQILIKSTVNLMQTATTVHAHYNLWVGNLEAAVIDSLSQAGPAAAPAPIPAARTR
jgi:hypothetical protein